MVRSGFSGKLSPTTTVLKLRRQSEPVQQPHSKSSMTERASGANPLRARCSDRANSNLLGWGVRGSFRTYLRGVGGSAVPTGGAVDLGESFGFPVVATTRDALITVGSVHFLAHDGLLDLTIGNLHLHRVGEIEELSGLVNDARKRIVIGWAVAVSPGESTTAPMILRKEAVSHFNGTYPPGTELDPIEYLHA